MMRGRGRDGGETPPSQPPRQRRSTCGGSPDRWRLAGWQCAVSARWGGRGAGVWGAGRPERRRPRLRWWGRSRCI